MCLKRLLGWFGWRKESARAAPLPPVPPVPPPLPPSTVEQPPAEEYPDLPDAVILPSDSPEEEPPLPQPPPPTRDIPPFPADEPVPAPYLDDRDYLDDELERIDLLIKAHLIHRKSARLMRQASEDSACSSILGSRFRWTGAVLDPDCQAALDRYSEHALTREARIQERLRLTLDPVRSGLRLVKLIRSFGLVSNWKESVLERRSPGEPLVPREAITLDVLLLALLVERAPRYRDALLADGEPGLTTESALDVLQPDASPWERRADAFAANGALLSNQLIQIGPDGGIQIDERIADYLLGKDGLDAKLEPSCKLVKKPENWSGLFLDDRTVAVMRQLSGWLWSARTSPVRLVVMLHGPAGSPFLQAVRAFLTRNGSTGAVLVVDVRAALNANADWGGFVSRCYREAGLRGAAVFWQGAESLLEPHPARWEAVVRQAERFPVPTFLTSDVAWEPTQCFHEANHYFVRVDFPPPTAETRRRIWMHRLAAERNPLAEDRTHAARALDTLETFQFTEGQIDDALATARGLALAAHSGQPAPDSEQLLEGCRRQAARKLVSFAQRVQPRREQADLKRIVLPDDAKTQLEELAERMKHLDTVHHRLGFEQRLSLGRGLVALFTGPSGAGKTMAATLLAGVNKKDLYKVDMAAVTSKFVGETEKNLNRVFADAQDANAVLFFDEADAMFGKRGEVEQAQDRWANLEVNFLLQRIEEYTGTVILATNFRQNIDSAFLRRVQVLIHFPLPKAEHRLAIFEGMFPDPEKAAVRPPGREQLEFLANRFELSGGSIKNVVLDAAFRCVARAGARSEAESCLTLDQSSLILGVAREYQKLGKPITVSEFGREFYELVSSELKLGRSS